MYPLLSFRFPIPAAVSNGEIIQAMADWVADSPHYEFVSSILRDILSSEEYMNDNTAENGAMLSFHRSTANGTHYIAMRLDRPDEACNLLWRVDCIFAREAEGASIHVRLYRAPLVASDSVCLKKPKLPYIIKVLQRRGLIEEKPESAAHLSQSLRFPSILCDGEALKNKAANSLQKRLGPIAVIRSENGSLGPEDVRVEYPAARINKTYYGVLTSDENNAALNGLIEDVIRWVNEVQSSQTLTWIWSDADPSGVLSHIPSAKKRYCVMNKAMANILRQRRQQCGLSQQRLAEAVGSSGLIISRLETGRVQRVETGLLHKIERALDMSENMIAALQGDGEPAPAPEQPQKAVQIVSPADGPDGQAPEKAGFCRRCGTHLYQDSLYCSKCGTKVLR